MPRVAVVGGGVGACSLVYGMREQLLSKRVSLTLFEMGRGAGGRAATRATRDNPDLLVDHGAPAFAARSERFHGLCTTLLNQGLRRCDEFNFGALTQEGNFVPEDKSPPRFSGMAGRGMGAMCDALLRGGDRSAEPLAERTYGTMVTRVEPDEGGWRLYSKQGDDLGRFDWLVVTSTAFGHPRWTTTFGGEPPLVQAAKELENAELIRSLEALAPLTSKPVAACLLAYKGEDAARWARLPFYKARVDDDDKLSRIVVQRLTPELTAVVLHSTHDFATRHAAVYGAKSTAARVAGAASDASAEQQITSELMAAAETRLAGLLGEGGAYEPCWGPHLHRWGAAFPGEPLLDPNLALVPSARVAFCGDFVASEHPGSVEGAALSGLQTAAKLIDQLGRATARSIA